ncbi:flagellar M-ring protein FliF C-terminal domain-containing protein [Arsukibacterium perlucidum]|uniref:flagellar M-ring protein FliF C-terminal domain-containing protein n=1 Tax=Arsukibacterium perlucidum TaxID=368811 RepID=UPI00036EA04E|nr:flagellar M-ring protein FliF C-terminal domain-containing protein [Arsukibacterium perlucidum]
MSGTWSEMSVAKRISFVALLGMLVICTLWGIVYVTKSHYQLLPDLSQAKFADVVAATEKDILDYQIDDQGRVLINERDFSKVQMLIQQSTKPAFNSQGLELYDDVDYSMTEHTQKVTYQRALQGELERTLTALEFIQYARVHLSFAERKLFSSEQKKAKAAVTLFAKQPLLLQQIRGVQQLVAASVDGLDAADVTILGGEGQILSVAENEAFGNVAGLSPHATMEQRLEQKAAKVLEMFFTPSQFAISVNVELDFAQRKAVSQHVLPLADGKGAIKQQRQTTSQQPAGADSTGAANQSTETEYLHGTRTEEVKDVAGKISRISLAAVIQTDVDELTRQQLHTLLMAATGINIARGDSISVEAISAPFKTETVSAVMPDVTSFSSPASLPIDDSAPSESHDAATSIVSWWWLLLALLICLACLVLAFGRKRRLQSRKMTLLQVQQWLKDGHHAL